MEYGCPVSNRYGFASDDDDFEDPSELVQRAAKEAAIAKTAPKKVTVKTDSQPAKKAEPKKSAEKVSGAVSNMRGGRGRGRGGRGGGAPRDGTSRDGAPREGNTNLAERFGESNPRGRERGGRGTFRGGRGRGRQFDRHSGSDKTGVRSTEKKEGHGKGNWGTHNDEMIAETEPVAVEGESEEPAAPREKTAEELQYESDLAEYNKMKTLKEFKAELKAEAAEFKTRKGGEGVQEDFGKLIPLQKNQDHDEDKEEVIITRKECSKKVVPVNLQFAETRRGGQSGRGRKHGGEGRGEHRGTERGGQRTRGGSRFDASSAEDFPALK